MATRQIEIRWSTVEHFSAIREVDMDDLEEWAGNPAPDTISEQTLVEYLKSGREEPHRTYELEAMAEGVNWHDRDDPVIESAWLL